MKLGRINFAPVSATSSDDLSAIMRLANHIRDLDVDRHELQMALDDQIQLVQSLQNEIKHLTKKQP